ncbi:MAG: hypothetical protein ACREBH_04370 [Candidatus Micrarchaeaceae archaeon]
MQNIINAYTLSFVILSAFVFAAFLLYIIRRKELLNIIPVLASFATVYLLYRLIGVAGTAGYYNLLALDLCIALVSTILAIFYISKPYIFVGLVILLAAGFVIYASGNAGSTAFAGMFAIGTIYGIMYREFAMPTKRREQSKMKKREINRDVLQIILGIALVGIVVLFPYTAAVSIIFALILLSYTSNNLLANLRLGSLYRRAMDLERRGVTFGQGAIYLAASTALVMGFTGSSKLLLFGIAVLFFADSLATIIGVSARRAAQLPYNRYKTIVGTLTFFIVAAVAGYLTIGLYGVLFALILAFVESLNLSIDDNIRSGVVIVILNALVAI